MHGGIDVWWVAFSAFVTVFAGALALTVKRGFGWMLRRTRAGFVEWFGAAIDEHVAPKFDEIRQELQVGITQTQANTNRVAEELKAETAVIASDLRGRLDTHTAEEGALVRAIVQEELAPMKQVLDDRAPIIEADSAALARIEDKLNE